eukprot:4164157-Amphidinium_carterae.1
MLKAALGGEGEDTDVDEDMTVMEEATQSSKRPRQLGAYNRRRVIPRGSAATAIPAAPAVLAAQAAGLHRLQAAHQAQALQQPQAAGAAHPHPAQQAEAHPHPAQQAEAASDLAYQQAVEAFERTRKGGGK